MSQHLASQADYFRHGPPQPNSRKRVKLELCFERKMFGQILAKRVVTLEFSRMMGQDLRVLWALV